MTEPRKTKTLRASTSSAGASMGVAGAGARTGAALVQEADTQSFMQDFWERAGHGDGGAVKNWDDLSAAERAAFEGRGLNAKYYSDAVDARSTRVKSSDFGSKDFDALRDLDRAYVHQKGRKYFNGWSDEDAVILLYRDEKGRKRKERVPYDFYLWIADAEKSKLPPDKWRWLREKGYFNKLERDAAHPAWWRLYVDYRDDRQHGLGLSQKQRRERYGARAGVGREDAQRRTYALLGERGRPLKFRDDPRRDSPVCRVVRYLTQYEIDVCEADLTLKQRWVTDKDIEIEDQYREMYFDLETDDSVGGFEHKEENRILSIGWKNNTQVGTAADGQEVTEEGVLELEAETDEAEAALLLKFKQELLDRHDVLIAWNGWNFDFPVLIGRFEHHQFRYEDLAEDAERRARRLLRTAPGESAAWTAAAEGYRAWEKALTVDWRWWLFNDLLPVFKRHYIRAASAATSFSLDNIGKNVLKMRKLDWRTVYRERHPDLPPARKIIELYRTDRALLKEYNLYDVYILYNLEKFTGFAKMEQTFCRIGNCFANDFNISTKIDGLMLKKGFKEGCHFPSRFVREGGLEQYTGAHVFDPVRGVHNYVCAFDFKSLYPSMMTAFNLSPETWVPVHARKPFAREHPASCGPGCVPEMYRDDEGRKHLRAGTCTGHYPDLILCPGSFETFRRDVQGYIPQMFKETLFKRKKYTDLQTTERVGSDLFLLYYRLAYSFKRLGLSFYGELGNTRSRFYFPEVAESVTLAGQYFIRQTSDEAKTVNYPTLYGDTDSIYLSLMTAAEAAAFQRTALALRPEAAAGLPSTDGELFTWLAAHPAASSAATDALIAALDARGKAFVERCQAYYHSDMLPQWNYQPGWDIIELEFEDIYDIIFFVSKKRYAGRMLGHKGQRANTVEIKGLEAMRSDYVEYTRQLQRRVLHAILKQRRPGAWVLEYVRDYRARFLAERPWTRGLSTDYIAVTKSIAKEPADYVASRPLHVRLAAEIRETGREFYVGMKVPHVVTASAAKVPDGTTKTGKPKFRTEMQGVLLDEWTPAHGFDRTYYWDRVIYPATERVLEVCYPGFDWASFRVETATKRASRVEQLSLWLQNPLRRAKALELIATNPKNLLTLAELEPLRRAARFKLLARPARSRRKAAPDNPPPETP